MLAVTKVKMSGSEKTKRTGTSISSIKHVNRNLKEVSHFSRAKQRHGNVQKSLCGTCKVVVFVNCCFFTVFVAWSLVLLDFKFSLRKL